MAHGVSTRTSTCPQVAPSSTFYPSEKRGSTVSRLAHSSELCQKGSTHEGKWKEDGDWDKRSLCEMYSE
eukprot:13053333-Ditylum_brightwellii.AAC.1